MLHYKSKFNDEEKIILKDIIERNSLSEARNILINKSKDEDSPLPIIEIYNSLYDKLLKMSLAEYFKLQRYYKNVR